MTNEKICTSGHTIDAGKDVCQRCGASEPRKEQAEQAEQAPIPQEENVEEKIVDEIIEEETELDEAKDAEETPPTEEETEDTL